MEISLFSFQKWETKANHFRSTYTLRKRICNLLSRLQKGTYLWLSALKQPCVNEKQIIMILSQIAIYVWRYIAQAYAEFMIEPTINLGTYLL